jgi:hypothetical protein
METGCFEIEIQNRQSIGSLVAVLSASIGGKGSHESRIPAYPGGFMRTIRTFILRLLVDSDEPEALRGALQPVPEGETQPFAGDQALLILLRRMVLSTEETLADTEALSEK